MAAKLWLRWFGSAVVAINLCGCTMMSWDDLTSREFTVGSLWTSPPPPLAVIERSSDGYARTKALNKLDESSNKADVDKHLQVLQAAAINDRDPLCRLAALRTLGRYKDPRAAKILQEVYLSNPGMSAENNAFIRQQALTSLQASAPAEARQLFIQAALQPSGSLTGAAQRDRMEILDERLSAIRALSKYPQPDAIETLVKLLESEKDIAIRKCAHESLMAATKKDIPLDGKAWREFVATGKQPARQNTSALASLVKSNPSPAPAAAPIPTNSGSGVFSTISNWVRPEKATAVPASNTLPPPRFPTAPNTLPDTLPTQPLPPNQVRRDNSPSVVPAGASRNAAGETILNVNP